MRRLIEIATERRVTIVMLMVAIGLFGLVSLSRLNLNLLPDISYPTLTIRTELSGAAPMEVENLVTKPVEEAVGVIRNVRLVRSVSRTGQSDVTLEFLWGTDMDVAGVEVREKLDVLSCRSKRADHCSCASTPRPSPSPGSGSFTRTAGRVRHGCRSGAQIAAPARGRSNQE